MTGDADRFWAFSLRFYDIPEVADACLRLQDEAGLNVNLVLWCCWQAVQGAELSRNELQAAVDCVDEWSRTVTRPLRALRRRVKEQLGGDETVPARHGLYERLKTAELEAERVEQALLCRAAAAPGRRPATGDRLRCLARANLATYMVIADVPESGTFRQILPARLAHRLTELDASL